MFFTLLTFFFFAKPYFTVKRETLRVSLLLFLIFIPAMDYKTLQFPQALSDSITSASRSTL